MTNLTTSCQTRVDGIIHCSISSHRRVIMGDSMFYGVKACNLPLIFMVYMTVIHGHPSMIVTWCTSLSLEALTDISRGIALYIAYNVIPLYDIYNHITSVRNIHCLHHRHRAMYILCLPLRSCTFPGNHSQFCSRILSI